MADRQQLMQNAIAFLADPKVDLFVRCALICSLKRSEAVDAVLHAGSARPVS
jgi:hypothetical protein